MIIPDPFLIHFENRKYEVLTSTTLVHICADGVAAQFTQFEDDTNMHEFIFILAQFTPLEDDTNMHEFGFILAEFAGLEDDKVLKRMSRIGRADWYSSIRRGCAFNREFVPSIESGSFSEDQAFKRSDLASAPANDACQAVAPTR